MVDDTMTETGAHRLARAIEAYWAAQGHVVKTRVDRMYMYRGDRQEPLWFVRSDLGMNMPPLSQKAA